MKCYNKWSYRPYLPVDRLDEKYAPFVCRIAPTANSVTVQWFDNGYNGEHYLHYSEWESQTETAVKLTGETVTVGGLSDETEYKFYITAGNGKSSRIRRFRTGDVPGNNVVCYLHPEDTAFSFSGQFTCSPSIVRLPNGALLASNDYYIGDGAQNYTTVFRSDDDGQSWYYVTDIMPCFWGKLFWHNGALYLLGTSTEYGDLLIGRSDDEGKNWTTPTVLMRGACNPKYNGMHKAPMRIEHAAGRLWTAIDYGSWAKKTFANAIFSVSEDADLLNADNWVCTGFLPHDNSLPLSDTAKWAIEGNAVLTPDGRIANVLRYTTGKAKLNITDPSKPEDLPECMGIIDMPVGHTKFEILRHESGKYYAVGNLPPMRTRLVLISSDDLIHWNFERYLIDGSALDEKKNAFQYPSALLEGNTLTVLSRTALNNACNWHNSNYITFHRYYL